LGLHIPVSTLVRHWRRLAIQRRKCKKNSAKRIGANPLQMYVMSSLPPGQQSLAGGIFNTVTKVCSAVGLGISASIYNAESTSKAALQTSIRPYSMVFWFCVASAGTGLLFVPFLTIGTQGHSTEGSSDVSLEDVVFGNQSKLAIAVAAKDDKQSDEHVG
jgi:hypothetical protein